MSKPVCSIWVALASFGLLVVIGSCSSMSAPPEPPMADIVPKELEAHGDVRIDNYYWLREREDSNVIAYLKAENTYTDAVMARIGEYVAAGVSKFILRPIGADDADIMAQTQRLIDETLPAVKTLN